MNSQHIRVRRASARALVALVLLAGVFVMHGLTGNHDVTMAITHQMSVTVATDHPSPAAATSDHDVRVASADEHGHEHSMTDMCLAMLAALLLALIVALARRSLTAAHPVQLIGATIPVAPDWPSPLWCRPTLSKLCILRT
ncbi:hypothetical protein GCM10009745_76310 [Kribbella yunnanensis]|uniref:DUF2946 domain-containing protein n=1 Tax=Kribbella yunnanensis TaxID=190194 RepID=A0ABP4V5D2_9ACTN